MKKSLVSPSVLKQKAKQLRREKSLIHSQALDEVARQFGFSNYKNYLNILEVEANRKQAKPSIKAILKNISSENDMFKKVELAISSIQNFKISFHEQLDILKLFQNSEEDTQLVCEKLKLDSGLHGLIQPWLQFVCEKLNFMKDEIQSHLFEDFLIGSGKDDINDMHPYFIAKEISISDLMYEIGEGMLRVFDADYKLKLKFDLELDENDPISKDERFDDRGMSGSFGVEIDRNKKITFLHSDMSIHDDTGFISMSRF